MKITDYEVVVTAPPNSRIIVETPDVGTKTVELNHLINSMTKDRSIEDVYAMLRMMDLPQHSAYHLTFTGTHFPEYCSTSLNNREGYHRNRLCDLIYASMFNGFQNYKNAIPLIDNLGSAVTDKHLEAIRDGNFEGLSLGSFWEINNNYWQIIDFDYYYGRGVSRHHAVIMPEKKLGLEYFNNSGSNASNLYFQSHIRSTLSYPDGKYLNLIFGAFGKENILPYQQHYAISYQANGFPDAHAEYTSYADIPTTDQMNLGNALGYAKYSYMDNHPFALFANYMRLAREWGGSSCWCRQTSDGNKSVASRYTNKLIVDGVLKAENQMGVRPYFLLAPLDNA